MLALGIENRIYFVALRANIKRILRNSNDA